MLTAIGATLERWIVGRILTMAVDGGVTLVGLLLIGMPLALTLGLLAFVLAFIPFLGAILSYIPALLVALTVSPTMVLYVSGVYLVAEMVDSYVANPLIQHRAVHVPPGLSLPPRLLWDSSLESLGSPLQPRSPRCCWCSYKCSISRIS